MSAIATAGLDKELAYLKPLISQIAQRLRRLDGVNNRRERQSDLGECSAMPDLVHPLEILPTGLVDFLLSPYRLSVATLRYRLSDDER